ncbi:MAG: copper homeostasis protein CutC [Gemmatimonadaceae bacterium]
MTLVEACVGSLDEALAAEQGGAHRLELCDRLDVGGTTPSIALIDEVKRRVRIPVSVMIRPRGGSYVHTAAELDQMRRDIDVAREHGADMLVIGVLDAHGHVDALHTRALVARASGTPVTFHRAFDEIEDQAPALEALIAAGISRVLTGGGSGSAADHATRLAQLVGQSADRTAIMAAGKVRGNNVRAIVNQSGVREVHARCERDPKRIADILAALA